MLKEVEQVKVQLEEQRFEGEMLRKEFEKKEGNL